MSERTHRRKRSLQDSTVNLSKMRMALNRLDALKEELDGIEETEEELHISEHFLALENILKGAKKPVCYLFFALCAIVNDAPESDFFNRCIRRPEDLEGWRQEETSRFQVRESNRVNEWADNECRG
jgi:hypothetical protein